MSSVTVDDCGAAARRRIHPISASSRRTPRLRRQWHEDSEHERIDPGQCTERRPSTSSSSARARVGYTAAVRAAQLGLVRRRSSRNATGAASASTSAASRPRRCCATPNSPTSSPARRKTFGIQVDGEVTLRLRRGLPAQPQGRRRPGQGRPLPDEEERHHRVRRPRHLHATPHTRRGQADGGETITFDQLHHRHRRHHQAAARHVLSERVVTYEEQILADELPESIVIAGAGAIGVEFAYVLHNYGVKVTIVEFLDRLVPAGGRGGLRRTGQALPAARHRRCSPPPAVESIDDTGDQVQVTVARDGQQQVLEADKVLQAIGFAPRSTATAWRTPVSRLTERGAIDVDGRCRTNVPHIFAIGDVTAKLMLAHAAESMGIVAAETIAGAETMELDYVHDPARHVLPAADRQFRLHRGAGPGPGLRRQGGEVPVHRQRQGARPGRPGRLRQDPQRRQVRRAARRAT